MIVPASQLWQPKSVSTNSVTIRFLLRLSGSGDTRGRTLGIPSRNYGHCSPGNIIASMLLPVLVATWAVWIPLMAVIYSLPLALQFPLFALALAFWVLMMTYMTNRFAGKIEADAELPISVAGNVEELKH